MRIVVYHLTEKEDRPAIVVKEHSKTVVNLTVFLDGNNDRLDGVGPYLFDHLTSVTRGKSVGHWQELES